MYTTSDTHAVRTEMAKEQNEIRKQEIRDLIAAYGEDNHPDGASFFVTKTYTRRGSELQEEYYVISKIRGHWYRNGDDFSSWNELVDWLITSGAPTSPADLVELRPVAAA